MNGLLALFNPYKVLYFLFNPAISFTKIKTSSSYFLKMFLAWLVLTILLVGYYTTISNFSLTHLVSNNIIGLIFITWLMQTLSIVTSATGFYRIYLTKNSLVQTWWVINVLEVKFEDIFAIDFDVQKNKKMLKVYIIDHMLGGTILERLISDAKLGFHIDANLEFVNAIKAHVPNVYLSPNLRQFPSFQTSMRLSEYLEKYNKFKYSEKKLVSVYAVLLLIHPFTLFLILNYFMPNLIVNLVISSLILTPIVFFVRRELSQLLITQTDKKLLDKNTSIDNKLAFIKTLSSKD